MVSRQDIQATCDDIVREFKPLQVILFGSYAYGTPKEYSDVDLLVVMPVADSETRDQAVEIRERIPHRFSMDLLVRSPEDIAYRISHNDWFLREITEKGVVLYESEDFYFKPHKKENTKMNPLTLEWIEKAEGEFSVAEMIWQGKNPIYRIICFYAQQCVEKYLKALIQELNVPFTRTRNFEELVNLILLLIPSWSSWEADLLKLSKHVVDTHYPNDSATANDATHAMQTCQMVRNAVRAELKLPTEEIAKNSHEV